MKFTTAIIFLLLTFLYHRGNYLTAQDNVAQLTLLIGSKVEFNFYSFDDYNNGITLTNVTTLGIRMEDLPSGGTVSGWHLDVEAWNGATQFNGLYGNTLPLNILTLEASDANGNLSSGSSTFNGAQVLSAVPNELMNSSVVPANPNLHQVNISYSCGTSTPLLGEFADFYTVEIEITLVPDF